MAKTKKQMKGPGWGRKYLDPAALPVLELPDSVWEQRAKQLFTAPGASRFSADLDLKNPVHIVEQLMACPELWPDLERGTTDPNTYEKRHQGAKHVVGDDRMEGWFPIFVAYKLSRTQLPTAWWDVARSNTALWSAAGFKGDPPSRTTTWERFRELERFLPAIEASTTRCWERVRTVLPDAGRHWIVDGTAFEENVRAHHACADKAACKAAGGDRMPAFLKREPLELVEELRKEIHNLADGETHPRLIETSEEVAEPSPTKRSRSSWTRATRCTPSTSAAAGQPTRTRAAASSGSTGTATGFAARTPACAR